MTIQEIQPELEEKISPPSSRISSMSLLQLAGIMLFLSATWRIIDVFVLQLGTTWLNILPSKICPFLIIALLFWRYRRDQVESVLGLSNNQLKMRIAVGLLIGFTMYFAADVLPILFFASFVDRTYPLDFHLASGDIFLYSCFFFLFNALLEETLFRGLLQNGFRTKYSANRAILLSAFLFGMWHLVWPLVNEFGGDFALSEAVAMTAFSFIFGSFLGIYYEKFAGRASLIGPISAHALINVFNENFKFGPEGAVQGPDYVFNDPRLMLLTFVFFLVSFLMLIGFVSKQRFEQVVEYKKKVGQRFVFNMGRSSTK